MVRGQKALITLISIVIFLALSSFVMADDGCCCEQSSPNPENYYLDANECAGVYGTFEIMTEDMLYAAHISYGDDLELFCENRCTLTPAELCGNGLLDTDELCDPGNQPEVPLLIVPMPSELIQQYT